MTKSLLDVPSYILAYFRNVLTLVKWIAILLLKDALYKALYVSLCYLKNDMFWAVTVQQERWRVLLYSIIACTFFFIYSLWLRTSNSGREVPVMEKVRSVDNCTIILNLTAKCEGKSCFFRPFLVNAFTICTFLLDLHKVNLK